MGSKTLCDRDNPVLGLVSLFASTHPPNGPQSYLLSSLPLVPPPFVRLFTPCSLPLSCACCHSLCFCKGPQRAEICFQKAPGQDLAQKSRFPMIPEGAFNCRPASRQSPKIWLPKGSWPGFGPKRPFPKDPRREIQSPAEWASKPAVCQPLNP